MISKEEFKKLIEWYEIQNKEVDKFCEIFPDSFSATILDNPYHLFDLVWNICFDEEGKEWIDWWLYDCKKGERQYTENGEPVNVESVDDLWKLVKNCRK